MRNCFWGLMLLIGSIALAEEAEKPVVEFSASDSTTWRFCLQDPSEWKMPDKLSEKKRASWIATRQAAIRAQVKTEEEAAKLPTRELQLKSGSVPKNIEEKKMVLRFQKQKVDDQIEVHKLRLQQSMDEIEKTQKRIQDQRRQLRPSGQQA